MAESMSRADEGGRAKRVHAEAIAVVEPFALDLERIQFSPYFSRLSAVTQVVSPSTAGAPVHNRLTHTLKVSAIARAIALGLNGGDGSGGCTAELACNPTVVEAASYAHDLGHPPFGHLGERVLDQLARHELGLVDGFEGNAQTYRILTALDVTEDIYAGLNLTAAVRAATAKYPWAPSIASTVVGERGWPKGIRCAADGEIVVRKYSAYEVDRGDLAHAREAVSAGGLDQTVEGAVMDIADDIAYSVHDIDDFYRAGVLDHAPIAAEFRGWLDHVGQWGADTRVETHGDAPPGAALESLRRKMHRDDGWIAHDEAFYDAVRMVDAELIQDLLAHPFDGSLTAERRLAAFSDRRIRSFRDSVAVRAIDDPRAGPVSLSPSAWHHVEVLKFVHKHFVLGRPDLAIQQRGLSRILARSVRALVAWLDDDLDRARAPRRLRELVGIARVDYARAEVLAPAERERAARGRGVLDYVASLTDEQALALSDAISGRADRLWAVGQRI